MNKLFKYILFSISIAMIFSNCSDDDLPPVIEDLIPDHEDVVYEISFYKMNSGEGLAAIQSFLEDSKESLTLYSGRQLINVLELTDPILQNDALPSAVRSFESDFVVIHSFPNEEAFQRYSNEQSFKDAKNNLDSKVAEHTQLLSIAALSPPGVPVAPEFGITPPRPVPAFYLMNFLTLKPDTTSLNNFNTYLALNTPRILNAETVFSRPFFPALVLNGNFQMPVAFISFAEFKDNAAFDFIHNDSDALQNIFPLRNEALTDFVEVKLEVAQ